MRISPDMKAYDLDFAMHSDVIRIKELLKDCALPWQDITPMHLRHFLALINILSVSFSILFPSIGITIGERR